MRIRPFAIPLSAIDVNVRVPLNLSGFPAAVGCHRTSSSSDKLAGPKVITPPAVVFGNTGMATISSQPCTNAEPDAICELRIRRLIGTPVMPQRPSNDQCLASVLRLCAMISDACPSSGSRMPALTGKGNDHEQHMCPRQNRQLRLATSNSWAIPRTAEQRWGMPDAAAVLPSL